MPITQDRFIRVLAHADALLDAFDSLRRNIKQRTQTAIAMTEASSALEHLPPGPEHDTVKLPSSTPYHSYTTP